MVLRMEKKSQHIRSLTKSDSFDNILLDQSVRGTTHDLDDDNKVEQSAKRSQTIRTQTVIYQVQVFRCRYTVGAI